MLSHQYFVTYQVKVFAGLTKEKALHAVLFGFVHNMVEGGVPTSRKNSSAQAKIDT